MRGLKTLLLAGVIAGIPAVASAQWYVGADAGINFGKDTKYTGGGDSTKGKRDAVGFTGLVQGGYAFNHSSVGTPKVELEAGWRYAGFNKFDGVKGSGQTNAISIMLNGIYEFMPTSNWHPFLGAGIGTAWLSYENTAPGYNKVHGDEWKFAYQGIAGVAYDFNKNLAAKLQYRYFATAGKTNLKFAGETVKADYYSDHSILVGLTYKFNKPAPAPVAAAAPVAAPAPAPMAKTFEVFFDFDKYNITPAGQKVIDQAVASAKAGNATRIDLTGHTDTVGSDKYNLALSLKRANAVKAVMVKEGIAADIISAKGVGKAGLLVPTPDGVREAQNRRVEILIP